MLGLSSGSLQSLDMASGQVAHSSSSRQHEHAISSLACCNERQQFVACSSDHCARLYDSRYRLHAVLEHGRPQATCCFLNQEGDLLLATGRRLLVVRAGSYLPRKRECPKLRAMWCCCANTSLHSSHVVLLCQHILTTQPCGAAVPTYPYTAAIPQCVTVPRAMPTTGTQAHH